MPAGEASAAPSHSASSAIISPGIQNCEDSPSNSLAQSCTSLKERDYIGLAEVSSAPPPIEREGEVDPNLAETDLRLRLGPSTEVLLDREPEGKDRVALASSHAANVALHSRDDAKPVSCMPSMWQSIPAKGLADAMATPPHVNVYQSPPQLASSKNGGKRLYAEAMVTACRDSRPAMNVNSTSVMFSTSESRSCANPMKPLQDPDAKSYAQGLFRVAPRVAAWQSQNDSRASSYQSIANQIFPSAVEGDGEALCKPKLDLAFQSDRAKLPSFEGEENMHDEAPPAKGQVVGWPPVRSYRRSTLAMRPKPVGEDGDSHSTIYVKVNMDGIPIGRKVDLRAYKSYDGLLSALEDMFRNPNGGYGTHFLKGSEFVLTYEDKEGDWMLVGDVPWGMFVNTVRRLRITRGPDMAGSRTSACHA